MTGGSCPPQGLFEPVICDAGWYCPPGGTDRLHCPEGSFCPHGSYQATKCSAGSYCPTGSQRDINFLPLGILLLVDIILITFTGIDKLRDRHKKSHMPREKGEKRAFLAKSASRSSRGPSYQEFDDEQYPGFTGNDLHMEPNIRVVWRGLTRFEQLGSLETGFAEELHNNARDQKTDLHLFLQSLSKCLGATKFALSFEFQDLGYKPPKSCKPILADVSGTIHAGSLWGVMGASGAGKCEF